MADEEEAKKEEAEEAPKEEVEAASEEQPAEAATDQGGSDRILDLMILTHVNIGTLKMNLRDVLKLEPGSIIEVQKNIEEPLAISVNNKKDVAKGEVVTIGESLGLRVLETSD